jgi:hypothetical protein
VIRNNIDIFNIFKYANLKDIIMKFYPVVSGIMNEDQFKELYKHATEEKFNFLTVISHNALKNKIQVRKNWNTILTLS